MVMKAYVKKKDIDSLLQYEEIEFYLLRPNVDPVADLVPVETTYRFVHKSYMTDKELDDFCVEFDKVEYSGSDIEKLSPSGFKNFTMIPYEEELKEFFGVDLRDKKNHELKKLLQVRYLEEENVLSFLILFEIPMSHRSIINQCKRVMNKPLLSLPEKKYIK